MFFRRFLLVSSFALLVIVLLNVLYGHFRYENLLSSLEQEYTHILRVQHEYVGDVLSGTTPQKKEQKEIRKTKIPIIMYHYVEYVKDEGDTIRKSLNIQPHVFEQQLKDLKETGYTTYFMSEVPGLLRQKDDISTRSAVLTFDDGYEDFYTYAFPILKKYGIKSTQYITYDFIGRKGFMNKKQINELIDSGIVEIGSHNLHHIHLGSLTDKQARHELRASKEVLEELFGIEIKTVAYPYGGYNEKTPQIARDAGYIAAVSVIPGAYHSIDELYYLSRLRAGMFGTNMTKVLEGVAK